MPRDVPENGRPDTSIHETVVANEICDENPDPESFIAEAMQNVRGEQKPDDRVRNNRDPTCGHCS